MNKTAKIMAACNPKGGGGKTVTAVNLSIGLAWEGKKVLMVDVAPQGSLTASLGYQQPDQLEGTLADVLGFIIPDKPVLPGMGSIHQAECVYLLPANIELSGLEVTLVNTMSRETILREYLSSIREQYDVILLECCPSMGMLTINALASADVVEIPMQAHYLSIKQRIGTAYPHHIKGKAENQPPLGYCGHPHHHGRYEDQPLPRDRGTIKKCLREWCTHI